MTLWPRQLDFETLTDLIYEAAVLPDLWPAVLDQLADLAGAQGAVLITADLRAHRWINSGTLDQVMADFPAGDWVGVQDRTGSPRGARHAGFILEEDV